MDDVEHLLDVGSDEGIIPDVKEAVVVSEVSKSYGTWSSEHSIHALDKVNLTVPKGFIYGLLGPSGCGKTTLLRCIIGRLDIRSGEIYTLGSRPGTPGCGIPGSKVGYMPQELALYQDFTVAETIYYFGRLQKMSSTGIKERMVFLLEFLHLPEGSRLIRALSGGQQRRVSFLIALLQEPDLLILDEPTVGVDPLLRERIWQHMLEIAHGKSITIIITTHYIEEAQQADMVGFMRSGRMLAEAAPKQLMTMYQNSSLEAVFLNLCHEDQNTEEARKQNTEEEEARPMFESNGRHLRTGPHYTDDEDDLLLGNISTSQGLSCCSPFARLRVYLPSLYNIYALFIKNLNLYKRNIGFLIFEFMLPALQIIMFCLCIGGTPKHLRMGVVNLEGCHNSLNLSCTYLRQVDPDIIHQVWYGNDTDAAHNSVLEGENWGMMMFAPNFSTCLVKRFSSQIAVSNETIEDGSVKVYLDMTNQQISLTIQSQLLTAFQLFAQKTLSSLKMNSNLASLPILIEDPIYGKLQPSFTDFMAPGVIISITFFMATGLTALAFVLERKQGLMDRSFTAGVTRLEMMVGHILSQFLIMAGQVTLLLIFALAVFKISHEGPIILVVILTLLQGLTGMALGLLISTVCTEETSAIMASLGSVYPNLLLSGIIWPLQAMPNWLCYISYALPMTIPAEAMRSILSRGWGLTHPVVYQGFLISVAWGWFLMALSVITLKLRRD